MFMLRYASFVMLWCVYKVVSAQLVFYQDHRYIRFDPITLHVFHTDFELYNENTELYDLNML